MGCCWHGGVTGCGKSLTCKHNCACAPHTPAVTVSILLCAASATPLHLGALAGHHRCSSSTPAAQTLCSLEICRPCNTHNHLHVSAVQGAAQAPGGCSCSTPVLCTPCSLATCPSCKFPQPFALLCTALLQHWVGVPLLLTPCQLPQRLTAGCLSCHDQLHCSAGRCSSTGWVCCTASSPSWPSRPAWALPCLQSPSSRQSLPQGWRCSAWCPQRWGWAWR